MAGCRWNHYVSGDSDQTRMPAPEQPSSSNFDVLRFLAVGIVVVGNGLILTGGVVPGIWGAPLPRIGLDVLFAAGGYLTAQSVRRSAWWGAFVFGRVLRVFPALAVSVILTAFVLGPFATTLPSRAYLLATGTRTYLLNALLLPHPFLPHAFEGQQWSGATNPMLWTLGAYAFGCIAILLFSRLRSPVGVLLLIALLFAVAALAWPASQMLPRLLRRPEIADALPELPFFFVAAALSFAGRSRGEALWRADLAMLCFAVTWIAATWFGDDTIVVLWLTLPYMAACFGRLSLPGLSAITRFGNPSYGSYLYAFPLQQLIVERWPDAAHPILLCLAGAIALGLLSWHVVERPALSLRPRLLVARPKRVTS